MFINQVQINQTYQVYIMQVFINQVFITQCYVETQRLWGWGGGEQNGDRK